MFFNNRKFFSFRFFACFAKFRKCHRRKYIIFCILSEKRNFVIFWQPLARVIHFLFVTEILCRYLSKNGFCCQTCWISYLFLLGTIPENISSLFFFPVILSLLLYISVKTMYFLYVMFPFLLREQLTRLLQDIVIL